MILDILILIGIGLICVLQKALYQSLERKIMATVQNVIDALSNLNTNLVNVATSQAGLKGQLDTVVTLVQGLEAGQVATQAQVDEINQAVSDANITAGKLAQATADLSTEAGGIK